MLFNNRYIFLYKQNIIFVTFILFHFYPISQKLQERVMNYPEFNKENFTIIVSPRISNIKIPLGEDGFSDLLYFSVDYFHISQKRVHNVSKKK